MSGNLDKVFAQTRDPFEKPAWQNPNRNQGTKPTTTTVGADGKPVKVKAEPPPVTPVAVPGIQDRINYYKELRRIAAEKGDPLPKVTSVLTLSEMSVMGIFRTARGFAAMVQATPINLSYTIYPGEKFFDGQLVAIEENRLVFRKVTKLSNNKFVSSEENKSLRQYSDQEEIQGTAPAGESGKTETAKATQPPPQTPDGKPVAPVVVVSPLDEMNKQPAEKTDSAKDKKDKKGKTDSSKTKKPVKVAANKEQ
ncbi:MAG: hypothetical protein K1X72_17105 [Pyrinomonadaceae bacterium]|nr:hypothetical protein [Pyrinomonadaceae bacterium]